MSDLDKTLEERGNRYGSFDSHAELTMRLKRQMQAMPKWQYLEDDQAESLHMIAHKIGRILNGDPDYADSWVDIAGYAQLVANRLLAKEDQSANSRSACESTTCDPVGAALDALREMTPEAFRASLERAKQHPVFSQMQELAEFSEWAAKDTDAPGQEPDSIVSVQIAEGAGGGRESQDAAKVAEPDADGWIEWGGGECPVPRGQKVEIRWSDGEEVVRGNAPEWVWLHEEGMVRIVAYRLVQDEPQWPMVSEPGDHSKIKAAYKPGMEWAYSADAFAANQYFAGREPDWDVDRRYAIRPAQGAQA